MVRDSGITRWGDEDDDDDDDRHEGGLLGGGIFIGIFVRL